LQGEDDLYFWLDGQPKPASTSEMNMSLVYRVEPAYLTAMGIPLKQGRFFANQDDERSQPVAVIDEAFARKFFPSEDPLGKRINLGGDQDPWLIIGVVGHVKQWSLDADDTQSLQAQLYLPFRQLGGNPSRVGVIMRAERDAGPAPFDAVRRVVQSQNSQNVVFGAQTMNEVLADSLSRQRFSMILLGAFAAVALLLASVGVYGVISYLVGQRTHELGVRIALGARRGAILRLVVNYGMKMAIGGVAIGLIAAFGLTRLMSNMLYGVSATDPTTFAVIALLLVAVAMAACLIPAWRATKVDPLVALRHE
jgi:predicted permease